METINFTKKIPVAYDVDVAVAGGGIAGISAAIAAAGLGKKVILIERLSVFGGNATAGGVANFCGNTVGQGRAFDTIIDALEQFGAVAPVNPEKDTRIFNHEILAAILPDLLIKQGVHMLLHCEFADVLVESGHIEGLIISGPSGLQTIRAKQYIDCTGDGLIAVKAGFRTMKGNEAGYQLPMSLMYFVRETTESGRKVECAPNWFEQINKSEDLPMTSWWPNGFGSQAVKIKVPRYDSTDTESLTWAEINGRRKMMAVLDYFQRVEKRNCLFDHCSTIIGIREGARILGDYVLTVDDLCEGRAFPDVIAVGTFYLDAHKPDDDKRTYILDKNALGVPPYDIPLRSLICRDCDNLTMGGRCFSAEQLAMSSARVMPTCAMTGQAAAVLAVLAADRSKALREIPPGDVQSILVGNGAELDKSRVVILGQKPLYKKPRP